MSMLLDSAEAALRAGRAGDARAALERALAEELPPNAAAEANSMLGLAMLMTGEKEKALGPLERAVKLDPAEGMFRYNLARGLELIGRLDEALAQHREAVRLSRGQGELVLALVQALIRAERFSEAAEQIAPLASQPTASAAVIRLHAQCLHGAGDLHAAIDIAEKLRPADISTADAQGRQDALLLARLYTGAMLYDRAEEIGRALLARDPRDAEVAALLAPLALWTEGPEAARAIIDGAVVDTNTISPELLVQLLGFNDALPAAVLAKAEEVAERKSLAAQSRANLLLALAQYWGRTGEPERAWALAEQGNEAAPQPEPVNWRGLLDTHLALYREIRPASVPVGSTAHLYLCGPPRSGQSLIQSILAAAPGVTSLGERGALLRHLLWRAEEVSAMPTAQKQALYQDLAEADRRGLARLVGETDMLVDKNPFNLAVAGSIARIHPTARFAAVLRDPGDVAVSIYLRGFPSTYDYAANFGRILDYLDFVLHAIEAWHRSGLEIRLLDHGAMVADPAHHMARLSEWLGIEWDEAYLAPQNRTQPVPTFSAAQVRQPISAKVSGGAAPYREFLLPYAERLEDIRLRQDALLAQQGSS